MSPAPHPAPLVSPLEALASACELARRDAEARLVGLLADDPRRATLAAQQATYERALALAYGR